MTAGRTRTERADRLRTGAFYTPARLAEFVTAVAISGREPRLLLDPACGDGAFLRAARAVGYGGALAGRDISEVALAAARTAVPDADLARGDLLLDRTCADTLIGNPPFVRHARRDGDATPTGWSARADLAAVSLAACLDRLLPGGRLAFVLPSTLFDAGYGQPLRRLLTERFHLVALVESTVEAWFADAAINTMVAVIDHAEPGPARFVRLGSAVNAALSRDLHRLGARIDLTLLRGDTPFAALFRAPPIFHATVARTKWRPLGEQVEIGYGTKPGASAFFCPRGGLPGVEASCQRPFLSSLKGLHRPALRPEDADAALFVAEGDEAELPPGARAYIVRGAAMRTSAGQPLPDAPSLRTRKPWWRLVPQPPGDAVIPQFRADRHVVLRNCGLTFNNSAWWVRFGAGIDADGAVAVLNTSWMALAAEVYGRRNLGDGLLTLYGPELSALPTPPLPDAGPALLLAFGPFSQRPRPRFDRDIFAADRRALDAAFAERFGFDAAWSEAVRDAAAALLLERRALAALQRASRSPS